MDLFSKYKKKILLSIAAGALIFLIFSIYADFGNLITAFSNFTWRIFPLVLLLSFGNYIIRFLKWEYYLRVLNIRINIWKSFLIFFASFTMSVTPGKMGEVLKSFLLKEETGTAISVSAPIILAERITDFLSIVMLALIGAIYFDYGRVIIMITGIVFIIITIMISFRKFSLWLIEIICRIGFIYKHKNKLLNSYDSIYNLIKPKHLLIVFLISLVAWFLECYGFYIVLQNFSGSSDINISILSSIFIYAFSTLLGAIAMMPGGLGATETSITGLLIMLKIPKEISVASTMIIRVATLWFAVLIGIIALQILNLNQKRFN